MIITKIELRELLGDLFMNQWLSKEMMDKLLEMKEGFVAIFYGVHLYLQGDNNDGISR